MKFLLFCLIGFFLTIGLSAQKTVKILNWSKVGTATAYQLEISNLKGEVLKEERIKENSYIPDLDSGDYYFRVAVVNSRGNIAAWTDKVRFRFKSEKPPILTETQLIIKKDSSGEALLFGKNLSEDLNIVFESEKGRIPIEQFRFIDFNTYALKINVDSSIPGEYNIKLINEDKEILNIAKYLSITGTKCKPELERSKQTYYIEDSRSQIIIKGKCLRKDLRMKIFSDTSRIIPEIVTYEDQANLSIALNYEDSEEGKYQLSLESEDMETVIIEDFITLSFRDAANKEKYIIKQKEKDLYSVLWRSALVPGYGQFYRTEQGYTKNESWKLLAYSGLFLSGLVYGTQINSKASKDYNNLLNEETMEIFFIIAPVPNTLPAQASPGIRQISPPPPANPPPLPIREYALLLYMQTQQKKADVQNQRNTAKAVLGLSLGIYLWNLSDAYLFHPGSSFSFKDSAFFMNYENESYSPANFKSKGQFSLGYQIKF